MGNLIEFRNGASIRDWIVRDNLKSFLNIPFFNLVNSFGNKIIFFNGDLTDNPELNCLKGLVPRGWNKSSWEKAAGIHNLKNKIIFIGVKGNYESMEDCGVHESGHCLDVYLGNLISGKPLSETEELNYVLKKEPPKNVYYNIPEEFFADGFDDFYRNYNMRRNMKRKFPMKYNYFKDLEKRYVCNFA